MADKIVEVFTTKGQRIEVEELKDQLMRIYATEKYPEKKALGSIGGAVKHGFIKLIDGKYERIK